MDTHVETLIIGAGQAGLALGHHLAARGRDHVLLERGRVGERWRSERWDSFRLLTPNWHTGLPGMPYDGDDPDGFLGKRDVIAMFDRYAASLPSPVHTGVAVSGVRQAGRGWRVTSNAGPLSADNVVVATGHHALPRIPMDAAARLPVDVTQLHTSHYRTPAQLPAGGVLIVGAGPSGQQIAEELARSGRHVVLAAGRHRTLPRRYRGRDIHWWMHRMGTFDRTVDSLADPRSVRSAPAFVLAGGCHDLDLRRLVALGVVPTGRLAGAHGHTAWFADDLEAVVAAADRNLHSFRDAVDDHVVRTATACDPPEAPPGPVGCWARHPPRTLRLDRHGIRTVIWATGFRRDFSWIDAAVFDATGEPVQRRGVTAADGLYFLGLRWMHRRGSDTIHGVGADAAHLADVIAHRGPRFPPDRDRGSPPPKRHGVGEPRGGWPRSRDRHRSPMGG